MSVEKIIESLTKGCIVCFPTETLYALAVDAYNSNAVEKLYNLKGRPKNKPCAIMLHDIRLIEVYTIVNADHISLMKKFLPGPVTFVLQKREGCSLPVGDKVGVRIPQHNDALSIIKNFDRPILTTSANFSNEPNARYFADIPNNILAIIDSYIKDDSCISGVGSTVIDITTKPFTILRHGQLTNITL